MTDQTAPDTTNHDRRLAHSWAETVKANPECWGQRQLAAARVILDDLPDPPPPTLADMLPKERAACKWMQADVADYNTRYVIADPHDEDGETQLLADDGTIKWIFPAYVTPRPDLPRMEWPGDQKPDPAPGLPDGWLFADHQDYGRVVVTRPQPDNDGEVVIICPHPNRITRTDTVWCRRDKLTYLDAEPKADQ